MFRKIPQPWFLPKFDPVSGGYSTEDLPFYEMARAAGWQVWVDQDASRMVGHVGRYTWYLTGYSEPGEVTW